MIKYYYIHGQHGRVLTIAYEKPMNGKSQCGFAINKFNPNDQLQLDQRLKMFLGNEQFSALQKAFIHALRGDPHNKKIARAVSSGRLRKYPIEADILEGEPAILGILRHFHKISRCHDVLEGWQDNFFNEHESLCLKHAENQRRKQEGA